MEIIHSNSLEVIAIGGFRGASLELKNMPKLKNLLFSYDAFCWCSRAVFENLPELTSIQLGENAFSFDDNDGSSELIMRNLPKLESLTVASKRSHSFMNPQKIILVCPL